MPGEKKVVELSPEIGFGEELLGIGIGLGSGKVAASEELDSDEATLVAVPVFGIALGSPARVGESGSENEDGSCIYLPLELGLLRYPPVATA